MAEILVTSLVSSKDKKPRVDITLPSNRIQMSADEALNFAKQLIECVQGSFVDSFLCNWLLDHVLQNDPNPDAAIGPLLQDFRIYRENLRREFESYQREADEPTS